MRKPHIFMIAAVISAAAPVPVYAHSSYGHSPTGNVTHQYPALRSPSMIANRPAALPSTSSTLSSTTKSNQAQQNEMQQLEMQQLNTPPAELPQNASTQPGIPDPSPGQPSLGIQGAAGRPPAPSEIPSSAP